MGDFFTGLMLLCIVVVFGCGAVLAVVLCSRFLTGKNAFGAPRGERDWFWP